MRLLLLGVSQAGKSTYGGQLVHRFETGSGETALKERRRPEHTRALDSVVDALLEGRPAERTSQATHDRVTFHLQDQAVNEVNVLWPEFGGEAFKSRVLMPRALPARWAQDARESDGLLLLLRPAMDPEAPGLEANGRVVRDRQPGTDEDDDPTLVVPQPDARYVELLQLILHVRGASRRDRADLPLVIGLSFWDELQGQHDTPEAALRAAYPLLAAYLRGAWQPEAWRAYGLSPQGRPLHLEQEGYDEAFAAAGPTANGFVALPDGTTDSDLTLPLAWLAERARAT